MTSIITKFGKVDLFIPKTAFVTKCLWSRNSTSLLSIHCTQYGYLEDTESLFKYNIVLVKAIMNPRQGNLKL